MLVLLFSALLPRIGDTPVATPTDDAPAAPSPVKLTFGDVDGDGLDDVLGVDPLGRVTLWHNRGAGEFEDITLASGLEHVGAASCAVVADFDGDGDLDVFAGSAAERLWVNAGNASFAAVDSGLDHPWIDLGALALDLDEDGRLDLYVATEVGDVVYRNTGTQRFERVDLSVPGLPAESTGTGLVVAPDVTADSPAAEAARRRISRWVSARAAGQLGGGSGVSSSAASAFTATTVPNAALAGGTSIVCANTIVDQALGNCIEASSVPALGKLYPLSTEFWVSAAGNVGIGTTVPSAKLHIAGTLRATGQITSTVASGTPPFVIDSPSRVLNLNADLLDGLHASSFSQLGPAIESLEITDLTIVNADIALTAAILGTKVVADFGAQTLRSSGDVDLRGMRLESSTSDWASNVIGGYPSNVVLSGVRAATIAGGGKSTLEHLVTDDLGTIGGGWNNTAGDNLGTTDDAKAATVGGGINNDATGSFTVIGGGDANEASGSWSVVPGGRLNVASGTYSFAAGVKANALHDGCFVWNDQFQGGNSSTAPQQFLIKAAGGVGIGTNAPQASLHVAVGGVANAVPHSSAPLVIERGSDCYLQLMTLSTSESGVLFGNNSSPTSGGIYYNAGVTNGLTFRCNGNSTKMVLDQTGRMGVGTSAPTAILHVAQAGGPIFRMEDLDPNGPTYHFGIASSDDSLRISESGVSDRIVIERTSGRVGIGTASPAFLLHVDGSAGKPGGGSWSVASDARLKTKVAALDGALAKVLALRGVTFEYIDPQAIGELEGQRVGFIAQEVEAVFPDWVEEAQDGYKRLSIRGFEAVAVEAMRELSEDHAQALAERDARIAVLEAQLSAQGSQLSAHAAQLEEIRATLVALAAKDR